jgi:DNA-directed RNA polymerase specialized sigma24 family protein
MPEPDGYAAAVSDPDWDAAWKSAALDSALARLRERYADNTTFQAFESVVIRGQAPEVVADALGISRDSVYQARTRLLAKLRLELDAVERILDPE